MKLYVQYWNWDLANTLRHATGTDQIYPLDGRFSLPTAIRKAYERAGHLHCVRKFDGFTIHRGNLRHNVCIHSELPTTIGQSVFDY